jgi:hypothetical protein
MPVPRDVLEANAIAMPEGYDRVSVVIATETKMVGVVVLGTDVPPMVWDTATQSFVRLILEGEEVVIQ